MANATTYEIPFKEASEGVIVVDASKGASTEELLFLAQEAWRSGTVTRTRIKIDFEIGDVRLSVPGDH